MTKEEKLKQVLQIIQDSVSKEDFIKLSKILAEKFSVLASDLKKKADENTKAEKERLYQIGLEFHQIIEDAKKESDSTLGGFRKRINEAISSFFLKNRASQALSNKMKEAGKIIEQAKNLRDGKSTGRFQPP